MCRSKAKVANGKDLPLTNFALLRVHSVMREEKRTKTMLDKYRLVRNPKYYTDIEEIIERARPPFKL